MIMTNELILMIGIPGCGKSTFRERFLPYHQWVNLDSIHQLLSPDTGYNPKNRGLARTIEETIISDRLKKNLPVVIDNTNVTEKVRSKYFTLAEQYETEVKAVYFTPDLKRALRQIRLI